MISLVTNGGSDSIKPEYTCSSLLLCGGRGVAEDNEFLLTKSPLLMYLDILVA